VTALWIPLRLKENQLKNATTWLRISYWVGATADGSVATVMFAQAILAQPSPLTHYVPETPYRYAMGLAGSLMLGWTILLLWADRKPVERRGILMITNVVIVGLMGSSLFAVSAGFMPPVAVVALFVLQAVLIVLFTSAYVASTRQGSARKREGARQIAAAEPLNSGGRIEMSDD